MPEKNDKVMAMIKFMAFGQQHVEAYFAPAIEELTEKHVTPRIRAISQTAHAIEKPTYYRIQLIEDGNA